MAQSVGTIQLDLKVNTDNFKKQMSGLQRQAQAAGKGVSGSFSGIANAAKSLGRVLAGVFAVKKIVDFGAACVKAANTQIEAETKLATVMRQRMGATESQIDSIKQYAAELQKTGVVGDEVALSGAQQLSTFLKTTDSLKTLMPAMENLAVQQQGANVTAEKMVSIGNLMGKVMQGQTSALTRVGITFSEAEEQVLKYGTEEERAAMLAQVITNNVGAMNSAIANTPAGQIAMLKNNFGDLMEVVGQGILNFLMPAIKVINIIVQKLMVLAKAFRAFSELITGKKASGGAGAVADIGDTAAESFGGAGDAADTAGKKVSGVGKAAKKAAKEMRSLMGFDQINKLSEESDTDTSSSDAGSGSGAGGAGGGGIDMGGLAQGNTVLDETSGILDGLITKAKELGKIFISGFNEGFGNSRQRLTEIGGYVDNIGTKLSEIWTDPAVQSSVDTMVEKTVFSLGQIAGSAASIGVSVAANLLGGFSGYLDSDADYIKERIVDITTEIGDSFGIIGEFAKAIGDIFDVLAGPTAIGITADLMSILSTVFLTGLELATKFTTDLLRLVCQPIIDNADLIKTTIEGTLEPIKVVLDTLAEGAKHTSDELIGMYDEHIRPMFEDITGDLSDLMTMALEGYNKYVKPVLDEGAEKFTQIYEEHIQPATDKVIGVIGEIADTLLAFWNGVLMPIFIWMEANIWPIIAAIVKAVIDTVLDMAKDFSDAISIVMDIISGILKFLQDVFKGDWDAVWQDIADAFGKIWDSMVYMAKQPINVIIGFLNDFLAGVEAFQHGIADAINSVQIDVPDWVTDLTGMGSLSLNMGYMNIPRIPMLAKGGYIGPNTPRLAMIGDNRTQGEFVAPEDKMEALLRAAVKESGGISRADLESIINNAVLRIVAALAEVGFYVDGDEMARLMRRKLTDLNSRYNTVSFT